MTQKTWRIGIVRDTSKPMLGLHGLHTAFRGLPNVDVVAHVDSNREDLEEKMAWTGARRHYATLLDMLASEDLDIVVLTSRHPYDHLPQIEAAADAGCHIYCEKPLTASLLEADRIIEIAEQTGIRICMAHPCRYAQAFRTMKQMLQAGEIGRALTAYGRGKCDHRGGGEDLIVLGTHILDVQTFLFGEPECVYADISSEGRPIGSTDRAETVEPIGPAAGDSIFAHLRFPGDVRGVFESRRGLFDSSRDRTQMGLTVVGTDGALSMRFDDAATRTLRICTSRDALAYGSRFEDVPLSEERVISGAEPLDYSLCGQKDIPVARYFLEANRFAAWDLIRSIEEKRQPISSAYNARLTQEMIQGIYAAHLSAGVIRFPLEDRAHPLGESV